MKIKNDFENISRKKTSCPYCGKFMDAHFCRESPHHKPSPNDITMCIDCYGISKFDNELNLIKQDVTELPLELVRDLDKLENAFRTVNKFIKERSEKK